MPLPYIVLIVKGDEKTAISAATAAGILDTAVRRILERETVLVAPYANILLVEDWFRVSEEIIEGFGFPAGTLLHYRKEVFRGQA